MSKRDAFMVAAELEQFTRSAKELGNNFSEDDIDYFRGKCKRHGVAYVNALWSVNSHLARQVVFD